MSALKRKFLPLVVALAAVGALIAGTTSLAYAADSAPDAAAVRQCGTGSPAAKVDDPVSKGKITRRLCVVYYAATAYAKANKLSPLTVYCYDNRSGDHGIGKACDFMYNLDSKLPTAARKAQGDKMAQWFTANRSRYGVNYIIWQGAMRYGGGWLTHKGGAGCTHPRSVGTRGISDSQVNLCHYNHIHVSVN